MTLLRLLHCIYISVWSQRRSGKNQRWTRKSVWNRTAFASIGPVIGHFGTRMTWSALFPWCLTALACPRRPMTQALETINKPIDPALRCGPLTLAGGSRRGRHRADEEHEGVRGCGLLVRHRVGQLIKVSQAAPLIDLCYCCPVPGSELVLYCKVCDVDAIANVSYASAVECGILGLSLIFIVGWVNYELLPSAVPVPSCYSR